MQEIGEITAQKSQLRDLIAHSKQTLFNYMSDFTLDRYSRIYIYKQFLNREKTIYTVLNMFKDCGHLKVGLAWVPTY
jgi:vacuolar-type H+-ATPase subunit I/STV1